MGDQISKIFVDVGDYDVVPNNFGGFVQCVFLLACYAFVLFNASNLISDGSELLLLVPSVAGIVGSVVLPVLGAVPDGAIVLFSGLGADAKEQLSVGVGALAGSTIMLLTIPWALSIVAGRVNIDPRGEGNYQGKPKLDPPGNKGCMRTGVNVKPSIRIGGYIMMATSLSYFVIQGAAFGEKCGKTSTEDECGANVERWFCLAGLLMCIIFFIAYLVYQVKGGNGEDEREAAVDEARKKAIELSLASLSGVYGHELEELSATRENASLLGNSDKHKSLDHLLKGFYKKYDVNNDGRIDRSELTLLIQDLGEKMSSSQITRLMNELDTDGSGEISYPEFCRGMKQLINLRKSEQALPSAPSINTESAPPAYSRDDAESAHGNGAAMDTAEAEADSDEEEEVPEDLQQLSPQQQQRRIKFRSFWMMGLGTILILLFSDPMCDALASFGNRIDVPPFYVAFVLAPLASNASELIAAYNYALKKTKKTITISLSALEGAACMNNTFCLGIFLALIFAQPDKDLTWSFSAETISIVFVELGVFFFCFRRTQYFRDAFLVLAFYPISIGLVVLLEAVGLN